MTEALDRQDAARRLLAARLTAHRGRPAPPGIPPRQDPEAPAALSPAQARILLASQYQPASPAYNVPLVLHLRGRLDGDALAAAVRDLAQRHTVLRSVVADGTMRVRPAELVPVTFDDLTGAGGDTVARRLLAEAARPFTLDSECPLRAACLRLAPEHHALALTIHHVAADASSNAILVADLARLYTARVAGEPPPDPPRLQYADVAAWERDRDPHRVESQLRWWQERLRDLPPVLELPLDRPRPSELDYAGDCVALDLTADLSARVREVAAARQSTVSAVLLAAWQALLARVSGTTDVPVGVITSSRRHPDAEVVPGCFVDTLVVRGDLAGGPTGGQLLDRARDALLDAMSHAEAPLDRVVEAVRPERIPGVTPLFQAVLNVYNAPDAVTGFAGLAVELAETFTRTARFDVSVAVADPGPAQPLRGRLIYRTALFDRATAVRLRHWYVRLLAELLTGLDRPVAGLPVADLAAGTPALAGPHRDYPLDAPVHAAIERHARATPGATAVVGPDGTLTYRELAGRAGQLARRLRTAGAGPDTPVAVLAEPGVDLPVGMLAVMLAGGAYLPLDPDTPPGRVAGLLAAAGCPVLLTQRRLSGRFDGAGCPVIAIDGDAEGDADGDAAGDLPPARPTDLAYAIFTSGSTGQPKLVAVEHRSIVHYLHAVFERLGRPAAGGRSFALLSTAAADLGMTCLLGALTTGGTLHLPDRATAVDPGALAGYLAGHPVDVMKLVPSHLRLLARHGDLAGVLPRRLLILAGEACPWSLVEQVSAARPDLAVQSHYGPTETTVAVLACDVAEVPPEHRNGYVPLGRPLANMDGYVVDAAGAPLPDGLVGELVIAGPGVARGYLGGDAAEEPAGFGRSATGQRRYRTGDRVRVRADGTVEFHGRIDDQVKIRGYRVEPGEVAAALRRVPGVADAVVLGEDGRLLAWLVPGPGSTIDGGAVLAGLRQQIPEHLVPAAATVVDALPLGPNGKVDRAALPRPEAAPATRAAPETGTEREIAALWQELLGCEVGRDDDFFALGGDSFRAVLATRRIGRGLRAIDLFTHPTVRGLAALLEPAAAAAEPAPEGLLHRLAGAPVERAELTVVCVPYGGGSAAAYRPLAQALGSDRVSVLALELPGHDPAHAGEELLGLDDVVRRCAGELAPLRPRSVLVYGHCVGTALAVALARRLADDGQELAGVVLGASFPAAKFPGRAGELLNRVLPTDRWLPDRSYRDALRVMGALIDEAGADGGDDAALLLRALRHDAREAEAWFTRELARPRPSRLAVPVLSVIGERDRGTELYQERYREWAAFAERVELATVPRAGHYFLNHQAGELAGIITGALARWRGGDPPPVTSDIDTAGQQPRRGLRAFRTVAYGQLVSLIGTQLSAFALGVWVYQSTGRLMDFAMITMLALVPAIVVAPLGGVLTDRYDRRRIMLASDTVSAVAVGSLALLYWAGRLELWHILLAVTAGSLATAVQRPAWLASISQLVPKPYLVQANALAQLGTGLGTLVAPLAGGVLVVAIGLPGVILIDMATFLVAVLTLLAVRFPARLFRKRDEDFRSAFAGGWRFIARRRPLVRMTLYFVPVNYLGALTIVLVTPLVLDLASPVALGAVTAAGGLGAAVGSLAMIAWGGTGKRAYGMVGFVLGGGAGTVLIGLAPSLAPMSLVLAGAGLFLWWAATSVVNAHWMAIIQVKVGAHLQGRVLAVNQMLAAAMMPLGFLTAPALAERLFGTGPLLLGSGAALLAWGVLGLCYRPLRELEADLPDAVAGAEIPDDLDEVQAQIDTLER